MLVNKSSKRIAFDVDQTLIMEDEGGSITLAYGGKIKRFRASAKHIELLKHHKSNGYEITVWSKNEWAWAEQVVKSLNLVDWVDKVESKFDKHVDDRTTIEAVVGNRIYLEDV